MSDQHPATKIHSEQLCISKRKLSLNEEPVLLTRNQMKSMCCVGENLFSLWFSSRFYYTGEVIATANNATPQRIPTRFHFALCLYIVVSKICFPHMAQIPCLYAHP